MPSMVLRFPPQPKDQEAQSHSLFLSLYRALSLLLPNNDRKTVSHPPATLPLSHALLKLLLAGAILWQLRSHRLTPLHHPSGIKTVKRHWWEQEEEDERTTATDLKQQQLWQSHCHSNICFTLSAAAGQFTAWEARDCTICILSSRHIKYSVSNQNSRQ